MATVDLLSTAATMQKAYSKISTEALNQATQLLKKYPTESFRISHFGLSSSVVSSDAAGTLQLLTLLDLLLGQLQTASKTTQFGAKYSPYTVIDNTIDTFMRPGGPIGKICVNIGPGPYTFYGSTKRAANVVSLQMDQSRFMSGSAITAGKEAEATGVFCHEINHAIRLIWAPQPWETNTTDPTSALDEHFGYYVQYLVQGMEYNEALWHSTYGNITASPYNHLPAWNAMGTMTNSPYASALWTWFQSSTWSDVVDPSMTAPDPILGSTPIYGWNTSNNMTGAA